MNNADIKKLPKYIVKYFDGIGFVNGLKNKNLIVENKDFAIFGIGGAGTSICYSLIRAKARRLKLINRNTTKLNLLFILLSILLYYSDYI